MRRLILILGIAATACTSTVPPPLPRDPWVDVLNAKGLRMAGFAVSKEKYLPGNDPRISGNLGIDARDRSGRTINAWGFAGWVDGNKVRVILLTQVVMPAAEPTPGSRGVSPTLRWEEFASYSLAAGETRAIAESKTLGLGEMSVRLNDKAPGP